MATKVAVLLAVVLPFLGFVAGIVLLWGYGFDWIQLALLLAMYLGTGMGITLGFHRLFTHQSFETVRPVKLILGVLGSMAVEGPLIKWVATHRRHHQHSDTAADPHSPHQHGQGFLGTLRGFWHAHTGWLLKDDAPGLDRYVPDLLRDRFIRKISDLFPLWVVLGLLVPTALGGLLTGTWFGALMAFIWAGLARIFLVHHLTWSINSVCHIWGAKPFRSHDESRNNVFFGIMGLGEGWHNTHHAFPTSARHGLWWWQFDATWYVIRLLEIFGLAWKVRLPQPEMINAKLLPRNP